MFTFIEKRRKLKTPYPTLPSLQFIYHTAVPYEPNHTVTRTPSNKLLLKTYTLKAIDEINKKFGSHTIHLLSSGPFEKKDRRYTTCWNELLVVG